MDSKCENHCAVAYIIGLLTATMIWVPAMFCTRHSNLEKVQNEAITRGYARIVIEEDERVFKWVERAEAQP